MPVTPLAVDPRFRVQVVDGQGVFALAEHTCSLFRGTLYERLSPLIDGVHDLDALVDELGPTFGDAKVRYAVARLRASGAVTDVVPCLAPSLVAFWRDVDVDPARAERDVRAALVEVDDLTATSSGELVLATLLADGVAARSSVAGDDDVGGPATRGSVTLRVVLVDDYLRPELAALNETALRSGTPWLLVKPVGRELWIGPVFRPGSTGCWQCLAQRLRGRRDVAGYLAELAGWPAPISVAAVHRPTTRALAVDLAALAVVRALATLASGDAVSAAVPGSAPAGVRTYDIVTGATADHALVRRPQCPACGDPSPPRQADPVRLAPTPVPASTDGGFRTTTPEAVLERYGHHVSPITGAVPALERVVVPGSGVPRVYLAGQNLALPARDLGELRQGLRSSACGKGVSDAQARASALCESLERYSGVRRGDEVHVLDTYRNLGADALHPNAAMGFSERQYDDAATWNALGSPFNRVTERFDEDAVVAWTPVWSLTADAPRLVPTGYCYYDGADAPGASMYFADSNGCAAGSTLTEAVLQGFLELVERDAVAMWWYHRASRPGVDLDSFDEPYLGRLARHYADIGRDLWALDLTHDLGIPTFVAVSSLPGERSDHLRLGFGSHVDARVALLRAATELNQGAMRRPWSDITDVVDYDQVEVQFERAATLANQPHFVPDPRAAARRAEDFPHVAPVDDLLDCVEWCRSVVEAHGMEVLVLDQTRPDIGLPVAKVFVPGLRHFWARFARGRLYDVPLRLGWISEPTAEADLNPIPFFM